MIISGWKTGNDLGVIEIGILLRDKMVCQISVEVEYYSTVRSFCYKYSSWFYVQVWAYTQVHGCRKEVN